LAPLRSARVRVGRHTVFDLTPVPNFGTDNKKRYSPILVIWNALIEDRRHRLPGFTGPIPSAALDKGIFGCYVDNIIITRAAATRQAKIVPESPVTFLLEKCAFLIVVQRAFL
jgi:hypothetical protein